MSENLSTIIASAYCRTHEHALNAVGDLSEEQLAQRVNEYVPSIDFHLWHIARWSDFLQEVLTEPGNQLWVKDKLPEAWGLSNSVLGYAETGYGMNDSSATSLLLSKGLLFDYVKRAFEASEQAVRSMENEEMLTLYKGPRTVEHYYKGEPTFAYIILRSIRHENRHVGIIESIRGILGFGQAPEF